MNKGRSSREEYSYESISKGELLMKYLDAYQGKCQLAAVRKKMALYAIKHGNLAASALFECHTNTVSKWKGRYLRGKPLMDLPRIPKSIPHKVMAPHLIKRILDLRDEEGYGSLMLWKQFQLPVSNMTIHRVLKEHDRVQPRIKKWRDRNELWHIKQHYKTLETKLQMDGKYLLDIPRYYDNYKQLNLPKWQFNIRCVKSGMTFTSFMNSENGPAAQTFVVYVFEHLKKHGIDVSKITLQVDAASYVINMKSPHISAFRHLVETVYGAKLKIVPGGKTKQSDVERFNGLVEKEFFRRFDFSSVQDFYRKVYRYMFKFNFVRLNRNKDWKPPIFYLNQDQPLISSDIMLLPPIDLDRHTSLVDYKLNPKHITLKDILALEHFMEKTEYIDESQYDQLIETLPSVYRQSTKVHTHDVPISVKKFPG